jgi:hypothetical protein
MNPEMTVYTVQAPIGALGEPEIERAVFLREGFSWGAFVFGFFWLAWHRLWAIAAVWLLAGALLAWLALGHLSFGSIVLIALALRALLGLEANALLRHRFASSRYRLVGVVTAATLESAERTFYSRAMQPQTEAGPAPKIVQPPPIPHQRTEVLGVFPEPETGR